MATSRAHCRVPGAASHTAAQSACTACCLGGRGLACRTGLQPELGTRQSRTCTTLLALDGHAQISFPIIVAQCDMSSGGQGSFFPPWYRSLRPSLYRTACTNQPRTARTACTAPQRDHIKLGAKLVHLRQAASGAWTVLYLDLVQDKFFSVKADYVGTVSCCAADVAGCCSGKYFLPWASTAPMRWPLYLHVHTMGPCIRSYVRMLAP